MKPLMETVLSEVLFSAQFSPSSFSDGNFAPGFVCAGVFRFKGLVSDFSNWFLCQVGHQQMRVGSLPAPAPAPAVLRALGSGTSTPPLRAA